MKAELLLSDAAAGNLFGTNGQLALQDGLAACRDIVQQQVINEFASESDPFGNEWEPWYWTSDYPPEEHKTLDHTGLLKSSLVGEGAGHIEEITGDELVYGTSVTYAMKHQEGGEEVLDVTLWGRHGGRLLAGTTIELPARPIVGWPDATIVGCENALALDVMEKFYAGL